MRVTNEQAEAEIICITGETCVGCPFNGLKCSDLRCNDTDAYRDLLDARRQRDDLLEALKALVTLKDVTFYVDYEAKEGEDLEESIEQTDTAWCMASDLISKLEAKK